MGNALGIHIDKFYSNLFPINSELILPAVQRSQAQRASLGTKIPKVIRFEQKIHVNIS